MTKRYNRSNKRNTGLLTPSTHISLTVIQFIAVVIGITTLAGGYWWLENGVATTTSKVDSLGLKVEAAIQTNTDGLKDQDAKREQLGKDFLAKQDQLNAKVTELTTSITVQQHDTSTIAATLAKISDQLNTVAISPSKK